MECWLGGFPSTGVQCHNDLTANNETTELSRGDSAHYPADVSHKIENIGRGEAVAFLVNIYERNSPAK